MSGGAAWTTKVSCDGEQGSDLPARKDEMLLLGGFVIASSSSSREENTVTDCEAGLSEESPEPDTTGLNTSVDLRVDFRVKSGFGVRSGKGRDDG